MISSTHDVVSFSQVAPGEGEYRLIGPESVHIRLKAFSVSRNQIDYRGLHFYADARMYDAQFAGSAGDKGTVARLGQTLKHALDNDADADCSEDLRPVAFFSSGTWSCALSYADAFGRFATDVVLEFRIHSGYS